MTDIADDADTTIAQAMEVALENRVTYEGVSADECIECGELIPSARQIAVPGCQLCITCAEKYEKKGRTVRCR